MIGGIANGEKEAHKSVFVMLGLSYTFHPYLPPQSLGKNNELLTFDILPAQLKKNHYDS